MKTLRVVGVGVLVTAALTGCNEQAGTAPSAAPSSASSLAGTRSPGTGSPDTRSPGTDGPAGTITPAAALSTVPADATAVTVTDFDAIRERLGVPDLDGTDLMSDRTRFWNEAERTAVLLTDGLLRKEASRLMLDYNLTQDDVDWEIRFSRADGPPGYIVKFRPDLDMKLVENAAGDQDTGLTGGQVLAKEHVLASGLVENGDPGLGTELDVGALPEGAESTYLRPGCIDFNAALGPDADYEDQEAVLDQHPVDALQPLEDVVVSFTDDQATAHFDAERTDLQARADLADDWPTTGTIGFDDAFGDGPTVGPDAITWQLANPHAAAVVTLGEELPFGVCNEARPFEEPTGL